MRYLIYDAKYKFEIWDLSIGHLDMLVAERGHAFQQCLLLNKIAVEDISKYNVHSFMMSESQRQSINRSKIY